MNVACCARRLSLLIAMVLVGASGRNIAWAQAEKKGDPDNGRELFTHEWKPGDPLSPAGDGLGPMHNATSCVACHHLGGIGGSGGGERNVDLLSAHFADSVDAKSRETLREELLDSHPGFAQGADVTTSLILHRFGTGDAYRVWRLRFFGGPRVNDPSPQQIERLLAASDRQNVRPPAISSTWNGIRFLATQRNTPALFGAGQIDKISQAAVEEVARIQADGPFNVSGRLPPAAGDFGRFGWRGQIRTLADFVLGACANELGLSSSALAQANDPLDPAHKSPGIDLTEEQCADLISFVRELPAPRQRMPLDRQQAQLIVLGEGVFNKVGCAVCHVRNLGESSGIYSDLLLHDMGSRLADPVPAFPGRAQLPSDVTKLYCGGPVNTFVSAPAELRQEWRTPPLWGVADSAPYLHDGRAATLPQAILMHGGEAQFSVSAYSIAPETDRALLIGFLKTLRAP